MKMVIAGATGLIGARLTSALHETGDQPVRLVRSTLSSGDALWDPYSRKLDLSVLEGADSVVCLSGVNIASGRWTAKRKRQILDSRVQTVSFLSESLCELERPAETLICASAVGFYGSDCGDTVLTEDSPPGEGFLSEVCREWEAAADPARERGIRVVHLRFGVVLAKEGGLLGRVSPVFRVGLGGPLGKGDQFMSWVTAGDAVRAVRFVAATPEIHGPVNVTSENPVTNYEFSKALGHVLHRPVLFPVPASAIRFLFGEMGEELLLGSARAFPSRLLESGFRFEQPEIAEALASLLGAR